MRIIIATRAEKEFLAGVSTRGSLSVNLAAQAAALADGRNFVVPEDVTKILLAVLTHRLGLRRQRSSALEERSIVEGILRNIIDSEPMPV